MNDVGTFGRLTKAITLSLFKLQVLHSIFNHSIQGKKKTSIMIIINQTNVKIRMPNAKWIRNVFYVQNNLYSNFRREPQY